MERRMRAVMPGKALTIVSADDHSFKLNARDLQSVLSHKEICNKNVVVVSVAGAFRRGKSFLLNYMLRYLQCMDELPCLGPENEPLEGFPWGGGAERLTSGILMWSQPFITKLATGEEVALLLLDTQGTFDSTSTVKECATIFALSTMLSSIQVYNLSNNIQEDDLQHLELFCEYGRLASESTQKVPFQKLVFLVRDWSYPYEAPYGEDGGKRLLEKRLQTTENQHPQLKKLRSHIRSCFSDVTCFLMPHPGFMCSSEANFDGRLSDLRQEFKGYLEIFLNMILAPENLVLKKIGGHLVTAKDLLTYCKAYVRIFQGKELPEPVSVLQATAEANNLVAVVSSRQLYDSKMENLCGGSVPYMLPALLERGHVQFRNASVLNFLDTPKMGDENLSNLFLDRLQRELDDRYASYIRFNESKRIISAARTPGTLLIIIILCYLLGVVVSPLGLNSLIKFFSLIITVCFTVLFVWCYIRYTGAWPAIGIYIDLAICFLWFRLIYPLIEQCKSASLHYAQPILRNLAPVVEPVRVVPRSGRP